MRQHVGADSEGEDAAFEGGGGYRHHPPDGDEQVVKVWQLLLAIFTIQAVMLGAHYSYTMSNVREMFKDHEVATLKGEAHNEAVIEESRRRITELESADRASIAERQQLRSDVERIEKDLTLIHERQAQVRAKLGIMGNGDAK